MIFTKEAPNDTFFITVKSVPRSARNDRLCVVEARSTACALAISPRNTMPPCRAQDDNGDEYKFPATDLDQFAAYWSRVQD